MAAEKITFIPIVSDEWTDEQTDVGIIEVIGLSFIGMSCIEFGVVSLRVKQVGCKGEVVNGIINKNESK